MSALPDDPLLEHLLSHPEVSRSASARELALIMTRPTGRTSAGYPYLMAPAWVRFRDWVPHILGAGAAVLADVERIRVLARGAPGVENTALDGVDDAARVVRQVVHTAAITAPPDLWLLRWVLGTLAELGVSERLLAGEVVGTDGDAPGGWVPGALQVDLRFLLARGYLLRSGDGYRLAGDEHSRRVFAEVTRRPAGPAGMAALWAREICRELSFDEREPLRRAAASLPDERQRVPGFWSATPEEIEVGFHLTPLVVGLQAAERIPGLLEEGRAGAEEVGEEAAHILRVAGVTEADGRFSAVGARVLERGPGPMGIIEAYHPYLEELPRILGEAGKGAWVRRSANVAASQLANRKSFQVANDALDRFVAATGFRYTLFIEHAMGRGEATRQRYERSGDTEIVYVGADLEDAAIDAALEEQREGHLPSGMRFVRGADIGKPETLLKALNEWGLDPRGSVMLVGNGFHEARDVTDEEMAGIFRAYGDAGIVLLFTEETSLSTDDLLETAWNTYHAGFRYVHERSGQGLRPASQAPPSALEGVRRASWTECAEAGGYLRAEAFSVRSRTVYPYPPTTGYNPAISVTHFFVPEGLFRESGGPGSPPEKKVLDILREPV